MAHDMMERQDLIDLNDLKKKLDADIDSTFNLQNELKIFE
jgi:hypothetical protein